MLALIGRRILGPRDGRVRASDRQGSYAFGVEGAAARLDWVRTSLKEDKLGSFVHPAFLHMTIHDGLCHPSKRSTLELMRVQCQMCCCQAMTPGCKAANRDSSHAFLLGMLTLIGSDYTISDLVTFYFRGQI